MWTFSERSGWADRERVGEGVHCTVFVLFVHELFWNGELDINSKRKGRRWSGRNENRKPFMNLIILQMLKHFIKECAGVSKLEKGKQTYL